MISHRVHGPSDAIDDYAGVPDRVKVVLHAASGRADLVATPVIAERHVKRLMNITHPVAEVLERLGASFVARTRVAENRHVRRDGSEKAFLDPREGATRAGDRSRVPGEVDKVLRPSFSRVIWPCARFGKRGVVVGI